MPRVKHTGAETDKSEFVPATLKTRKPVVKLTGRDFSSFPVWEFAIDEEGEPGQDETWVRPVDCRVIGRGAYVIVASDFSTRAGRPLEGFMTVSTTDKEVEVGGGAVIGRAGYRVIPSVSRKLAVARRYKWALRERDRLVEALGETEDDVFRCDMPFES